MKNLYTEKEKRAYQKEIFEEKEIYEYCWVERKSSLKKRLFSWNLKHRLENWKLLCTLIQIREILLREKYKGYYRKDINIKEEFDIGEEDGLVQKMIVYQNGFYDFCMARKSESKVRQFKK